MRRGAAACPANVLPPVGAWGAVLYAGEGSSSLVNGFVDFYRDGSYMTSYRGMFEHESSDAAFVRTCLDACLDMRPRRSDRVFADVDPLSGTSYSTSVGAVLSAFGFDCQGVAVVRDVMACCVV